MKAHVQSKLVEILSDLQRKSAKRVTVVELARHSNVPRSVIYRDHRNIVDMIRRSSSSNELREVEILRIKVKKLQEKITIERATSEDLAAICAHLMFSLQAERDKSERLEGRLMKVSSLRQ